MKRALLFALLAVAPSVRAQTVFYVKADAPPSGDGLAWATAFSHLQDALAAATPIAGSGQTVQLWISAGNYFPDRSTVNPGGTGDTGATFVLTSRVSLYGGFAGTETSLDQRDPGANLTHLTGDLLDDDVSSGSTDDNCHSIITISNTDDSVNIDGLTVRAGGGLEGSGGAAMITNASPSFIDCVFFYNGNFRTGFGTGGAIHVNTGSLLVERCRFTNNRCGNGPGGALYFSGTAATIRRCVFESNAQFGFTPAARGGAVAIQSGAALIEDCDFINNSAGETAGALAATGAVVRRCLFDSNSAVDDRGGAITGTSAYYDCTFLGNTSFNSGGAGAVGAGASFESCFFGRNNAGFRLGEAVLGGGSFVNCVFANNGSGYALAPSSSAVLVGCTLYSNSGTALVAGEDIAVSNCIFWANGPGGSGAEEHQIAGNPRVNYSFIEGLTGELGGTGNIGAYPYDDPLLVLPEGADGIPGTPDDDPRLRAGSPCIDAGDNTAVPPGLVTDYDGNGRFQEDPGTVDTGYGSPPLVDMGASEFQGTTCRADINHDGFLDGIDCDEFNNLFEAGDPAADYNRDGFVDGIDYDQFNNDFEAGC